MCTVPLLGNMDIAHSLLPSASEVVTFLQMVNIFGARLCVDTYLSDSSTSVGVTSHFDQGTMAL